MSDNPYQDDLDDISYCYEPDDDLPCDHEEYEVDWEGRATCDTCHESWWLTLEQHDAYLEAEARWHEEYDRAQRLENSWWFKAWCWLKRFRLPITVKRNSPSDEIPF